MTNLLQNEIDIWQLSVTLNYIEILCFKDFITARFYRHLYLKSANVQRLTDTSVSFTISLLRISEENTANIGVVFTGETFPAALFSCIHVHENRWTNAVSRKIVIFVNNAFIENSCWINFFEWEFFPDALQRSVVHRQTVDRLLERMVFARYDRFVAPSRRARKTPRTRWALAIVVDYAPWSRWHAALGRVHK